MMPIVVFNGKKPEVPSSCYVASSATIVGDVVLGEKCNIWPNAVIRGDFNKVRIGSEVSIQDGSMLHVDPGFPLTIGDRVTIGHGAILHGCTIMADVLIGMGSIVLNGARVESNTVVAAGAVVKENSEVAGGSLLAGVPAKVVKKLTASQIDLIKVSAKVYVQLSEEYRRGLSKGRIV
ncbi:MAG: gamma carbonic anhydrase family protein [Aigarchaeota archaeon]|nr:gamma carbonic anhydrase family protein [Aigarchaeota archaeon]